jgi:glycerol-3-phosphate acyltransferase PlsY
VTTALVILGGYLLGSMPFGYWVILLVKGEDIRKVGSGNIGATNVWRAYGRWYGIPIVLLDVAKGFVPGLVGTLLVGELVGVLAGGAAMLGHWRPLFLRFQKGGKTVATAGGTFFGVATTLGLIGLAIWIVVFLVTRYASLASLVTALSLPFLGLALGEPWPVIVFASIAAVAVILLHKENIARLRAGTESRFALRRRSAAAKSS